MTVAVKAPLLAAVNRGNDVARAWPPTAGYLLLKG